jgi:hypothetical protein
MAFAHTLGEASVEQDASRARVDASDRTSPSMCAPRVPGLEGSTPLPERWRNAQFSSMCRKQI